MELMVHWGPLMDVGIASVLEKKFGQQWHQKNSSGESSKIW